MKTSSKQPEKLDGARLLRFEEEGKQYPNRKHRKALKKLLQETGRRCAYSLEHADANDLMYTEVDHFDPTLKHPWKNRHGNLLPASRPCNGRKGDYWPSEQDLKDGLYVINPYKERDYGKHIFEDRETGKLLGVTPTGRFHIEKLRLNSPNLERLRLRRTKAEKIGQLVVGMLEIHGQSDCAKTVLSYLKKVAPEVEERIPKIDSIRNFEFQDPASGDPS